MAHCRPGALVKEMITARISHRAVRGPVDYRRFNFLPLTLWPPGDSVLYVMGGRFYVSCSVCTKWYHGSCVGVRPDNVPNQISFVCPSCSSNSFQSEIGELHCICQTPYDASRYVLYL